MSLLNEELARDRMRQLRRDLEAARAVHQARAARRLQRHAARRG